MIFFFNANGDLLKGNPDPVYQGSSNAGKIYAVAPLNPGLIADIYFTLPNGDEAGPYLLTNGGTVIEGKELPDGYALWFINLNSNLTQFAGDLTAQIGFYATEDMTAETADGVAQKVPVITTQAFNIVISRGVARTLPEEPTNDIYEQIVNTLTLLSQDISKISGIYPPASIKDIGEAAVTYSTTDGVTLKTTEQWAGTNGETFDIETDRELPIKGGKNIAIGVTEDGKFIEVKSTADPIEQDEKGKPGGVPTLDSNGQIPSSQLPTYVDDVIDGYVVGSTPFAEDWLSKTPNGAPLTPERDKIYIVVSEGEYINTEYRWSGTVYAELGKTTPLSGTTGQGTNIGMTQKAITDELAKKQDKLAIYTVNTAAEVTIPADDLAKIKADPNAIIVEIDSTRPSVETRFYKKGIDFIGGTVFVSIYTVVGAEVAEGCSIAYRELNTTTGVLTARHETNATSLAEVRQEIEGKYLPKPSGNPTEDSLVKVSSTGTSSWIAISDIKVPIIEIPSASTPITQEQANIIINNKDVTILYGTTQKIIYRKFTEYELTTTHLAYFVQFGGANPNAAQKIKQLVLTVDLNNLTVSRVELEIPRVSFITGTDEDENDVVLQTKFAKEVFDTPAVKANPTLKGTEEELTALQVGITKYKVPSKPSGNPTEDSFVKVSSTGSPSWQPVSDFLARPTSAANSDRVCIIPDGQTKFGYKNAYKTVYNVENVFVIRDVRGTVPQPDPQREQDGVNLRYLQANYNANPTLDGTEAELTGVTLNGTKYKVPSGGGSVDTSNFIKKSGVPFDVTEKRQLQSIAESNSSPSKIFFYSTTKQNNYDSEKCGPGIILHTGSNYFNPAFLSIGTSGSATDSEDYIFRAMGPHPSTHSTSIYFIRITYDAITYSYGSHEYRIESPSFSKNVTAKFCTNKTLKTLFGNQSIYSDDGLGNIDLYRHHIVVTGKNDPSTEWKAIVHAEIISSKNITVDSLTDFKSLVGSNFYAPASGVYAVGGSTDGFVVGITDTGIQLHSNPTSETFTFEEVTWATFLADAEQLNFADTVTTV